MASTLAIYTWGYSESELEITIDPWTTQELEAPSPTQLKIQYNFWFPQNLITNKLLLTGSLTDDINSELTLLYAVLL